jgi:hypothetical protein
LKSQLIELAFFVLPLVNLQTYKRYFPSFTFSLLIQILSSFNTAKYKVTDGYLSPCG